MCRRSAASEEGAAVAVAVVAACHSTFTSKNLISETPWIVSIVSLTTGIMHMIDYSSQTMRRMLLCCTTSKQCCYSRARGGGGVVVGEISSSISVPV